VVDSEEKLKMEIKISFQKYKLNLMKKISLFFTLLISILAFSQIHFEKAYFINNANIKTECLIKNLGWRNNPTSFEYKIDENSVTKSADIKNVQLFEIYNQSKYVRKTVKIDQSSDNVNQLSKNYEPEFLEMQVFLKELVSGDANLYKYEDGREPKFFLESKNKETNELIYKKYEVRTLEMGYNKEYQKQLEKTLVCSTINPLDFQKTQFSEKNFVKIVTTYNQCKNPSLETKFIQEEKGIFNLSVRPRIIFNSLLIENKLIGNHDEIEQKTSFGLGLEAEYIFAFNRHKWSVFLEPRYQYYKGEQKNNDPNNLTAPTVDYKSIEFPFGIRHYFFLNNKSKIFVNGEYIIDFGLKNLVEFKNPNSSLSSLEGKALPSFAVGIGYNYNNKYGIEFKYLLKKDILSNYTYWFSTYRSASLVFSYNIL
jgi:hypothetical protein